MKGINKGVAALLALVLAAPAFGADAVLKAVEGKVTVRHKGEKRFVIRPSGTELNFGDEIETKQGAHAHVVFTNGDTVLLKENTQFAMLGPARRTRLIISAGEFLIGLTRKLTRGDSFSVRTPAAVAAVRGTLFWGKTDENKTSSYASIERTITVTAHGKTLTLQPGQRVDIPFGAAPSAVTAAGITPAFVQGFAVDGSLEGLDKMMEKGR